MSVRNLTTLAQVGTLAPTTPATPPAGQVGGTRVGFTRNVDTGDWEILTGSGPGFTGQTQFWNTSTFVRRTTVTEFGGTLLGIFVGGTPPTPLQFG